MKKYKRKSIRLKDYNYSQPGAYFVTICAQNRKCLFGDVVDEIVKLSSIGYIVHNIWREIPKHFNNIELDEFVVMPNHIHGIIIIYVHKSVGVQYIEPLQENRYQHVIPKSIGSIIRSYKATVTRWCNKNNYQCFKWQRNYYEHIIRNEKELNYIREYIYYNPLKWALDIENPTRWKDRKILDLDKYYKNIFGGRGSIY